MRITQEDAVRALKKLGVSSPAKSIAAAMGTDSRAVATSLRGPVDDGRVTCTYRKGIAWYRFKRLTPRG